MKKLIPFLIYLFCLSHPALAQLPEHLAVNFSPVEGTVIMPVGDQFLVDLDASVNLQEGDILTLTEPGDEIIHPETKKVLGTVDQARGFLRVTEVKSGYSYARVIAAKIIPAKGDRVKRFTKVPTQFINNGDDSTLEKQVKRELPHLNWLAPESPEMPLLFFTLRDDALTVTDNEDVILQSYNYRDGALSAPGAAIIHSDPFQNDVGPQKERRPLEKAVDSVLKTVGLGSGDKRLENPGIVSSVLEDNGVWIGPDLDGNPAGIASADFDQDGLIETAVALENSLKIFRLVDGQWSQLEQVDFPASVHLLSLDSIDSNDNGYPELIANANAGTRINSQIIEFRDGQYRRIASGIPWFLRVISLPHEGRQLVGQTQSLDTETLYGTPFLVSNDGDAGYRKGRDIALPVDATLFSFIPFKGNDGETLYAFIDSDDYLQVYSPAGTPLWQSEDYYGGSEIGFSLEASSKNQLGKQIFLQQRLLMLPSGHILVPQNLGSRILERFRNFNKSRIVALEWNGFALQQSWRTAEQAGYLADFALSDADNDGQDELVLAINFRQKSLMQDGRSTVVIYELNQ